MTDERGLRIEAANTANRILTDLGRLSALVPRGPLRLQVDAATEKVIELAEAISEWKPA